MKTDLFIENLKKTGDILEACIESNIDPKDYQKEYETNTTFRNMVEDAVLSNDFLLDKRIEQLSKQKVLDLLQNGVKIKKAQNKYIRDPDGELIRSEHTIQETELPTPMYVIQYGLTINKSTDNILGLIRSLVDQELLPVEKARQILEVLSEPRAKVRAILAGETQNENPNVLSDELIVMAQSQLLGIPLERLKKND